MSALKMFNVAENFNENILLTNLTELSVPINFRMVLILYYITIHGQNKIIFIESV